MPGWTARVVGLVVLCATAGNAAAAGVRVRWLPTPDPRVVGYDVYVRAARSPHGAPRDAGMPAVQPDGTMTFTVSGLVAGKTYYVALTSYGADRTQSGLS